MINFSFNEKLFLMALVVVVAVNLLAAFTTLWTLTNNRLPKQRDSIIYGATGIIFGVMSVGGILYKKANADVMFSGFQDYLKYFIDYHDYMPLLGLVFGIWMIISGFWWILKSTK